MESGAEGGKKNELYQYEAPWPIYGLGWCQRAGRPFRLAIGSFVEEYTNKVEYARSCHFALTHCLITRFKSWSWTRSEESLCTNRRQTIRTQQRAFCGCPRR